MRKSQSSQATARVHISAPVPRLPARKLLHACKRAHIRVDSPNNSLLTMKNEMDYELVLGPLAAKTFSSRTSLGCPKNRTRIQTGLQRLWEMIPFCKGDRENDRIS